MPVHGEWRHLKANAQLAISTGIDPRNVVIAEDGVVVDLVDGRAGIVGTVPAGNVYVDGQAVGGITEATLKDRRILADEGVVTIVVIVHSDTGKLAEPPDFLVRGFTPASSPVTICEPNTACPIAKRELTRRSSD